MKSEHYYKSMTEALRRIYSAEAVADYLRWIITSDFTKELRQIATQQPIPTPNKEDAEILMNTIGASGRRLTTIEKENITRIASNLRKGMEWPTQGEIRSESKKACSTESDMAKPVAWHYFEKGVVWLRSRIDKNA